MVLGKSAIVESLEVKIAIHNRKGSYSDRWIAYCREHQIDHKVVNAYDDDIMEQVKDCDIFLWHFHQGDARDMNFAKQLLFSLEQAGKVVFPNWKTAWHFDDKLGQKYLFEAHGIQSAPAYAFYDEQSALEWAKNTTYPKVFKLRGGAGSYNVELAKDFKDAKRFIRKAFRSCYPSYDKHRHFWRTVGEWIKGSLSFRYVLGSFSLFFRSLPEDRLPDHKEYVYFQEFIPNTGQDYRVEVCGDKCIALVRYCRKGDFRASGGHNDHFEHELIEEDVIRFAFDVVDKLQLQAAAIDIVRDKRDGKLYLVENSYCYGVDDDEFVHGYWDRDAVWHDEPFNGIDWMIEKAIEEFKV